MLPPTRTLSKKLAWIAAMAALALAGCGGSNSSSTSAKKSGTPALKLHTSTGKPLSTTVGLKSSVLASDGAIPATYTCDGKNTSLPLSWSSVPPHTAELAIFLINGEVSSGNLFLRHVEWGVAGLKPSLSGIEGGQLPPGSVVGRSESGQAKYSICPAAGSSQGYAVLLYALPHPLKLARGFNVASTRERMADLASSGGILIAHYKRHKAGSSS